MTELSLNRRQYLELEKLALGVFQPLTGFMDEDQFRSSVEHCRLPDGTVFPLPVYLDVSADDAGRLRGANRVALLFNGTEVGEIAPESWYSCDKMAVAAQVFGTTDAGHPGVRSLFASGDRFVGGPVSLTRRAALDISEHELTPEETRTLFAANSWQTVVGFQTRNVPHRAHEHLQRVALELVDGLFIQPLIGAKKVGDYTPTAIVKGYQALIAGFYPADRVAFGILSTYMRYAGPREAVFHAIIRRNYGCTHFVVGRDHAGVGDYYGKYEAHDFTRQFDGELGIEILRLHGPYLCERCDGMVTERTCPHETTEPRAVRHVSGTDMRAILVDGQTPDPRIMRPEIVAALSNTPLFIETSDL